MDVIYLDFSKAFDTVPTARLMEKVKAHGITGPILNWLGNWLKDRTQRVVVNGRMSQQVPVTSGVPQGSILGPILFIIYINDLEDKFEDTASVLLKFADDTKLAHQISSTRDSELLQENLNKLWDWSSAWGMKFNTEKCHVLHLGRNNPMHRYKMGGEYLIAVEEEKDLGVIITDKLKPTNQCQKAVRVANGILSQVLRAFSYRDKVVLPRIFKTYVRPHLEYAVPVWSPWLRGEVDLMEKVQKRLVSAIQGLKGESYEEKLLELGIEKLEQRRTRLDLVQTFKIVKGIDKVDKDTWFQANPETRTRAAQGGGALSRKLSRLELRANFFSNRVIGPWNALSPELKQTESVPSFKYQLKPHFA